MSRLKYAVMTADIVIKNGNVVKTEGIIEDCGIAIENGKITAVAKEPHLPPADKVIDAKGNHILPGVVDPHFHLGIYRSIDEDMKSETAAVACGGVTTINHFTMDKRPIKNVLIPELDKSIKDNAYIDVTYSPGIMGLNHIQEMDELVTNMGVNAFKFFLNRPEYEALFNISQPDDGAVFLAMEKSRDLGAILMVHCENYEVIIHIKERLMKAGRNGVEEWNNARPWFLEYEHMLKVTHYAEILKAPLYIVHMTMGKGVEVVNRARSRGVELYVETCPHYLSLTCDCPVGKVGPPLRTKDDIEMLWSAVKSGVISSIGSDHAPMSLEKKKGKGDIWSMGLGQCTGEMMLPVMLHEGFNKRQVPLETIVRVTSTNPAHILNMKEKGSIAPGKDADIVIVDLEKKVKVTPDILHSFAGWTPYDGWEFTGWPVMTISRGTVVAEEGQVTGKPGHGKTVRRPPRNK